VIVVCGEALIDMIRNADGTGRASPGGGPFNTARALARLGVPTAFLGHLSEDESGRELAGLLSADGAGLVLATVGSEPTTMAVADVDSAGAARYRFVVEGTSAPT
jgi:fructokinase